MRFAPVAISELIGGVGKLFLGLFLANLAIRRGLPLPIVCAYSILGVTLGAFFGFIYLFLYYKKESKYVKREYTDKREVLKSVLKIGIPIAFATALSSLVGVIDLSIIMNTLRKNGYSESVSTVIYGNYTTLAVPMLTAVTGLLNMISLAALPTIAKCHSERRKTDLSSSIRSSVDLSMLLAIPSSFAFFLFPYEILAFLFEIGSATLGAAFLSCLAPAVFFYSLLTSLNTALEGMNKINSAMISLILGAIIKLLSSFILIRTDSIGALGAPLGTTLSYAFSFLFSLICIRREKSMNIRLFSSLKAPVITSLIASVGAIFIKLFIYQKNIDVRLKSLFILSAFGIFYFVFCLFITIKPKKHAILSSN
jgi:stage V sporulation protein B